MSVKNHTELYLLNRGFERLAFLCNPLATSVSAFMLLHIQCYIRLCIY